MNYTSKLLIGLLAASLPLTVHPTAPPVGAPPNSPAFPTAGGVEVSEFAGKHGDLKTEDGRSRVGRHGHLPEREVMTGIGPVSIRQPRVRDREAAAGDPGRIRFSPTILPPYMRRSKSIETLLPILYLKGISTGDFSEALSCLLGKDAAGLSASAIGRLKAGWQDDHAQWQKRDI